MSPRTARARPRPLDLRERDWLARVFERAIAICDRRGPGAHADAPAEPLAWLRWATDHLIDQLARALEGMPVLGARGGVSEMMTICSHATLARFQVCAARVLGPERSRGQLILDLGVVAAVLANEPKPLGELAGLLTRFEGQDADDLEILAAVERPLGDLAAAISKRMLSDAHPLLGRSFHRLVLHQDARLTAQLARSLYLGDGLDLDAALIARRAAHAEHRVVIEAVLGLVHADGRVDKAERQLVERLLDLAGLPREERKELRQALAHGVEGDPAARVARRALTVDHPWVVQQVAFAALVDGTLDVAEQAYIERLADLLGLSEDDLAAIQTSLAVTFQGDTALRDGLTVPGVLARQRRAVQRHVEQLVKVNLKAIVAEIQETGELLTLLRKSAQSALTDDEAERVRRQLVDVCKTVPALALFAAPGGTLLLPILVKVLPFSILPSSFEGEPPKRQG